MRVEHELHYVTGIRDGGTKKFYVSFYTQPTWRRLVAKVYHWYDMNKVVHWVAHRITRDYGTLSGTYWKRNADGVMEEHHGEPFPMTMPHCALQDERCYKLQRKGRADLATVEVTEADYNAIKAGHKD